MLFPSVLCFDAFILDKRFFLLVKQQNILFKWNFFRKSLSDYRRVVISLSVLCFVRLSLIGAFFYLALSLTSLGINPW